MCTLIKHVSEVVNSLVVTVSSICPLISHNSIPFAAEVTKVDFKSSIELSFNLKQMLNPNSSETETLIDLISSRQHSSEVFKSVFLSYSRNWDHFGGYMTRKLFCVLLGVHYIAFFVSLISQWFSGQFTQTKILPLTSDVQEFL